MGIDRFTPGKTPVEYEHPTKRADNAPDRPQVRKVVEGVFGDSFEYRRTIPLTEARLVPVNGWKTIGSIGNDVYDDYALFRTDNIHVISAKIKIDGDWSDYMSLYSIRSILRK